MKLFILKLDRDRELRFGFKALRKIRKKFGAKKVEELLDIQIDEIPVLVHAGLEWDDKELTLDKVEDLLDESIPKNHTVMEVMGITIDALLAQMGMTIKKSIASGAKKKTATATTVKKRQKL